MADNSRRTRPNDPCHPAGPPVQSAQRHRDRARHVRCLPSPLALDFCAGRRSQGPVDQPIDAAQLSKPLPNWQPVIDSVLAVDRYTSTPHHCPAHHGVHLARALAGGDEAQASTAWREYSHNTAAWHVQRTLADLASSGPCCQAAIEDHGCMRTDPGEKKAGTVDGSDLHGDRGAVSKSHQSPGFLLLARRWGLVASREACQVPPPFCLKRHPAQGRRGLRTR